MGSKRTLSITPRMCERKGCTVEFIIKRRVQKYHSNACWQIAKFKYPFSLEEARRLYATGLSTWKVAIELGVPYVAVRNRFKKCGYQ